MVRKMMMALTVLACLGTATVAISGDAYAKKPPKCKNFPLPKGK